MDFAGSAPDGLPGRGFDGYAIGGLSVGEGHQKMREALDFTTPAAPNLS